MNDLDAPLGLDGTGHDRACNHAALAVFALTAITILGGGIGWYVLRSAPAETRPAIEVAAPDFSAPAIAAVPVPADVPMLRQELRDEPSTQASSLPEAVGTSEPSRSITIIDGKTGKRETILLGSSFDDDDAPVDGILPASAPALIR